KLETNIELKLKNKSVGLTLAFDSWTNIINQNIMKEVFIISEEEVLVWKGVDISDKTSFSNFDKESENEISSDNKEQVLNKKQAPVLNEGQAPAPNKKQVLAPNKEQALAPNEEQAPNKGQ
ncbi:20070_t:CDS:2, partial [Racocetra persica]